MRPEQLIAEGRRLQRECRLLFREGSGDAAAMWYHGEADSDLPCGFRRWLAVDLRQVPGLPASTKGYITISTDNVAGGRVEVSQTWPRTHGTPLYARNVSVLPPIDAVFLKGSTAVGEWLHSLGWARDIPYNSNFEDETVAAAYERVYQQEHPMYSSSGAYAVIGGWHFPWPYGDWPDLIDAHLLVMTLRDSEPWVEVWMTRNGEFQVIQRIT